MHSTVWTIPRPCNDYSYYGALEIFGAITITINMSSAVTMNDIQQSFLSSDFTPCLRLAFTFAEMAE